MDSLVTDEDQFLSLDSISIIFLPTTSYFAKLACPPESAKVVRKVAKLVQKKRPWLVAFECRVCRCEFLWCRVCKPERSKYLKCNNHRSLSRHEKNLSHRDEMAKFHSIKADSMLADNNLSPQSDAESIDVAIDGEIKTL